MLELAIPLIAFLALVVIISVSYTVIVLRKENKELNEKNEKAIIDDGWVDFLQ